MRSTTCRLRDALTPAIANRCPRTKWSSTRCGSCGAALATAHSAASPNTRVASSSAAAPKASSGAHSTPAARRLPRGHPRSLCHRAILRCRASEKRLVASARVHLGHPGSTLDYTIELALYLKAHHLRPPSVQDFIPTPMSLATAMYYTGLDPLSKDASHPVFTERGLRDKSSSGRCSCTGIAASMTWPGSAAQGQSARPDRPRPGLLGSPAHSPRHDRS